MVSAWLLPSFNKAVAFSCKAMRKFGNDCPAKKCACWLMAFASSGLMVFFMVLVRLAVSQSVSEVASESAQMAGSKSGSGTRA